MGTLAIKENDMDDLISRQAAIDAPFKKFDADTGVTWIPLEHIEQLPSAQPEQHWIPCSERLPKVHESGNSFSGIYMQSVPVLVYGICEGEGNAQFHVATYCDDLDGNTYWSTELDAFTITEVKAWMSLPEPWKGEQP